MRIISKFKDYYDSCMKQGMDRSLVYVRKREEIGLDKVSDSLNEKKYKKMESGYLYYRRNMKSDHPFFDVRQGAIAFCGKIYPYLSCKDQFFYSLESFEKHFEEFKKRYPNRIHSAKEYFKKNPVSENEAIFLELSVPVFTIHQEETWISKSRRYDRTWTLIKNPLLKDYQFYKIFDTFTTYQEIQMFLGNQLCETQEADVPVGDDVDLAKSKGYDKWSFRKESTNRKGEKR